MKKILIITGCLAMAVVMLVSCGGGPRRDEGRAYMPDMTYSRAYETYAPVNERLQSSEAKGAHFNNLPVPGTIARGEQAAYVLKNDTTGYKLAAAVKNPFDSATIDIREGERLYLVNCGICHGAALDGNGPLYKNGEGPYQAAPKNLMAADAKALAKGTIFHVITYGKGAMGSYASQLSTKQRWMVTEYIKGKQAGTAPAAATDSSGAAPANDSVTATMPK